MAQMISYVSGPFWGWKTTPPAWLAVFSDSDRDAEVNVWVGFTWYPRPVDTVLASCPQCQAPYPAYQYFPDDIRFIEGFEVPSDIQPDKDNLSLPEAARPCTLDVLTAATLQMVIMMNFLPADVFPHCICANPDCPLYEKKAAEG